MRDGAHRRLQPSTAQRPRFEEHRASLEESDLVHRVVRKDVAALVIGGRECDPPERTTVLDIVEHRLDALVGEVGREAVDRCVHGLA